MKYTAENITDEQLQALRAERDQGHARQHFPPLVWERTAAGASFGGVCMAITNRWTP